jgi:hypothetical protein
MGVLDAPGALDGVDGTSITPPTGGSGIRGWLSGIYNRLGSALTVSGTVTANAGTGTRVVTGDVAGGGADSGSPVKVGGVFNSTLPTYTTGQRAELQIDSRGAARMVIGAPASTAHVAAFTPQDAAGNSTTSLAAVTFTQLYNGTSWDRFRNNADATVRASTADSSSFNGADQTNYNARGATVFVNVSAITSATLVVKVQGKDLVSGNYYDIPGAVTGSLTTTGLVAIHLVPGAAGTPAAGSAICSLPLPRTWRVVGTVTGTSVTSSVGVSHTL